MTQLAILDHEYVAAQVRAELDSQGLSQRDLARELDVTDNFVSRRLRGEVEFSVIELATVAVVLGVPVEQFLGGQDR